MTVDYQMLTKHGFDILPPENAIIKKNNLGFWKVYYQSNIDPTEWIEDINDPEIKVIHNNEETIYTTTIGIRDEAIKHNWIIKRTEKNNGEITHSKEISTNNKPLEYFGTPPPKKDLYQVNGIEENLSDITNWKQIAAIVNTKNPFYYDHSAMWWRWNHNTKCWEQTDETDLLIVIDKVSKKNTLASSEKSKALEAFKRVGRTEAPESNNDYWVQFGDTIVDVSTGERFLASPKYFVTNPIPWSLGNDVTTPVIDSLLNDWAGEKGHTLKQILAFSALPSYAIQRIFFLLGSGSNGKSTFLSLMRKFIGTSNVCSASLDAITSSNNKFASSVLYKKLVCEMGETNFSALQNTEQLKKLSGRDLISIEFKGKQAFEYINYAKIIIASNSIPETHDKTDGFFRRFVVVDFPNQYNELRDVLSEVPDEEYRNLALWSIVELGALLRVRSFFKEGNIEDRKKDYEKRSDPLTAFIKEYFVPDTDGEIEASAFYAEYEKYLSSRGMRVVTYRVWKSEMDHRGFQFERHRPIGRDNPVQFLQGLKRRTENEVGGASNQKQEQSITKTSVPLVPLVPYPLPIYEKVQRNRGFSTSSTSSTETRELINKIQLVISSLPRDNAQLLESLFGGDTISLLLKNGDLMELPAGTYKIV